MIHEVATEEILTCSECSKEYVNFATFFGTGDDLHKDCNSTTPVCPDCLEREEREREEKERLNALESRRKSEWELTVPPLYRSTDVNHKDYPTKIHAKAISWTDTVFSGQSDSKPFFGIIGPSGKCKTRIASQMIKNAIWKDKSTEWINATSFQKLVQNQWSKKSVTSSVFESATVGETARDQIETIRSCDLVVFDDLGKGRLTETVAGAIYDLIEDRTANSRAVIWTSNAKLDDLLKMLPKDSGLPIIRRLIEFSVIVKF